MARSVETTPDGFYAVCAIHRGGVRLFFWASWWTSSVLVLTPLPDAHGVAEQVEVAHARARTAILRALGARATVLGLDAEMAAHAARLVLPASEGYQVGEPRPGDASRRRAPGPSPRAWLQVLELSWPCGAADVRRAYRRLALQRHPDCGGTAAAFHALTEARDAALRELDRAG